jgi:hypothetical protein
MTKGISVGLFLLLVGCATEHDKPEAPLARLDLREALGVSDTTPIGVAIASDGKRFVFDEAQGLFRIDGERLTRVISMEQMPTPDQPLQLPVTDIVALAPNLFAMTAIGDGFLLDTAAMTLKQHFCYLPGEGGGAPVSISQRTDAIAYDAVADKIYAQPLTFDAAGEFQYAQVARYDRATGVDEEWHDAAPTTAATGSVVMADVGLVLGQGAQLSRFDLATNTTIPLDDLTRFGVRSIDGLAVDPVANTLVVVDKVTDAVFDIDLARISL